MLQGGNKFLAVPRVGVDMKEMSEGVPLLEPKKT
jgi:hypothetical protein